MPIRYLRRSLRLPASSLDALSAELWALGTLGFEVGEEEEDGCCRVEAYFADGTGSSAPLDADRWSRLGVGIVDEEWLSERDWLAPYREQSRPFSIGARFEVDPGDPGIERTAPPPGRRRLSLPASRAFGTGSHATTRLMVEGLERCQPIVGSVLDVGTGSGILSLVALALGARRVVALDTELEAVFVARENGLRNPPKPRLFAGSVEALTSTAGFDLVLANVLPESLRPDLPRLARLLLPHGLLLLSGLLWSRRQETLRQTASLGLSLQREERRQEWGLLELARAER